ncbi:response regulator, partial [Stenotrophomonas sp. YIM B06876]|uniref:response regulator n=1 Tax=Stenotrophomonas sp. YIM B06876 TaxID=3060211 RepID=UPI0027383A0D
MIDDDADIRGLVAEYFGKNDIRVSTGCSGREMFELFDREAIDLVLLDLKLPGEDGMQLARALRER